MDEVIVVYNYKKYRVLNDDYIVSRFKRTKESIEQIQQCEILLETAEEVPVAAVEAGRYCPLH